MLQNKSKWGPALRKQLAVLTCFMVLLAPALAGCAKTSRPDTDFPATYYPKCKEPLNYLGSRGGSGRAIAGGATMGAFLSGLTAFLVGAIGGRINPAGIVTSMGVGAVVGGAAGGISGAGREDNRQMAAYLEKIDGDISNLDTVEKAGGALSLQCYGKAFRDLLAGMKKGEISQAEANSRFAEIMAGSTAAEKYSQAPANLEAMKQEYARAAKQ